MKCPNCGCNMGSATKFCTSCGFDFSAPPVEEPQIEIDEDKKTEDSTENTGNDINDSSVKKKRHGKKEKKSKKKSEKKPRKKFISARTGMIIALIVILFAIFISVFAIVVTGRGNGKRVYDKLSSKIGSTITSAEKSASIELMRNSNYKFIPNIEEFNYIYECENTVLINGVHIPEWAIFCTEGKGGILSTVKYYDFSVMRNNPNGSKSDSHIDFHDMKNNGKTKSDIDRELSITPFVTISSDDGTVKYVYKYYYIDIESRDEISYYVTITFDSDGGISDIYEKRNISIESIISYEEQDAENTKDKDNNSSESGNG